MQALTEIDSAIAALVAYRAKVERTGRECQDSHEYLDLLRAIDKIEGQGSLYDSISQCEYDLGLTEVECLSCGYDCDGHCDAIYDMSLAPVVRISPTGIAA